MDADELNALIMRYNRRERAAVKKYAKRRILPFYFEVKEHDYKRWSSWNVDEALEMQLLETLRLKPRRSASGVVSITVLTKPHACPGACIFCPNDVSMPKSYLHAEPACQRAERCYFDPYLQVMGRLRSLYLMGHPIEEVELVILGGSWTHYSEKYRLWFASEMYRALNDWDSAHIPSFSAFCAGEGGRTPHSEGAQLLEGQGGRTPYSEGAAAPQHGCSPLLSWKNDDVTMRQQRYVGLGIPNEHAQIEDWCDSVQEQVNSQLITYNQAIEKLYEQEGSPYVQASSNQIASWDDISKQMQDNENAQARCVGLSLETRPDCIDENALTDMMRIGCDKLQLGVQSLDEQVLSANGRAQSRDKVLYALDLARKFGMRVHAHYMLNLYCSSISKDLAGFKRLVDEGLCDEIKLYPCVLTEGTELEELYAQKKWQPYTDDELVDLCAECVKASSAWVRISRMVRDISTNDILAGNKKPNLRQMVDGRLEKQNFDVQEIRHRELGTRDLKDENLKLGVLKYKTNVTDEYFLQLLNCNDKIVALCRLSFPFGQNYSIIRELHLYGAGKLAQEFAPVLCKRLLDASIDITKEQNCTYMQVIATPGRKSFYQELGFVSSGVYLKYDIINSA